jgi:hypothetical protein
MAKHLEELSILELANDVHDWITDEADAEELQSFIAEWRGIPISAVTVDTRADEIEIRPAEPVCYPTPEKALALIEALRGLFAQITGPVMVHGNGCGRDGTKTGLSGEEFEALRTRRIDAARIALRDVGIEV